MSRNSAPRWAACALAVMGLWATQLAPVPAGASPMRARGACRAPHLAGLTLKAARVRAARAGCELRLEGARATEAPVQTVAGQTPSPGHRAGTLALWLNPVCHGSVAYGPEIEEPTVTAGPTELISGFYVAGGPETIFSTPHCRRPEPESAGGTVVVSNAAGAVVASVSAAKGELAHIPLLAGSYIVTGTFLDGELNNVNPAEGEPLVIPAGHTVRQDFFLDVP